VSFNGDDLVDQQVGPGSFKISRQTAEESGYTFPPGRLLLCGWLFANDYSAVFARTALTVDVAPIRVSLRLNVPSHVRVNEHFYVRVTWRAEVGVHAMLVVDVRPLSGPRCAATRAREPRDAYTLINYDRVGPASSGSDQEGLRVLRRSSQRVCAWIQATRFDTRALAGPVTATVTVGRKKR
jgi:hypothetical protein